MAIVEIRLGLILSWNSVFFFLAVQCHRRLHFKSSFDLVLRKGDCGPWVGETWRGRNCTIFYELPIQHSNVDDLFLKLKGELNEFIGVN